MLKRLIILFFVLISFLSFSQDADGIIRFNSLYDHTYGASMWRDLVVVDSGYVCIGGVYSSDFEEYIVVSFMDTIGNITLEKEYGYPDYYTYHGKQNSLIKTNDNNYVLCGSKRGLLNGQHSPMLIKFNQDFDTLWTRSYLTDTLFRSTYRCLQTNDNGYMLIGYMTQSASNENTDILLLRTDSLGNELWVKTIGISNLSEKAYCIQPTYDNGFIIGG